MISGFYHRILFLGAVLMHDLFNMEKVALFLKVFPYTMIGYKRLSNAYELAKVAERENIKGAFVECGVWKGGTIGAMAYVADRATSGRNIWLFDSFEGLPEPTSEDGKVAAQYSGNRESGKLVAIEKCVGPLEDVKRLFFSVLKLKEDHIWIAKGWFQDMIAKEKEKVGPIAILRLDADWYESTKVALEGLHDNVVSGGYVIIDDYGHWEGCKKAVDEFLAKRNIKVDLIQIDYTGYYFKKP